MSTSPIRKDGFAEQAAANPNENDSAAESNPAETVDTIDSADAGSEQKPVDPRAAVFEKAREWNREDRQAPAGAVLNGVVPEVPEGADGAADREPMHEEPKNGHLPEHLQADPLADYIEMVDGAPAMRLKVDGREELVPLEIARTQLQKATAADRRLQDASLRLKQVEERERALAEREAEAQNKPTLPDPALAEEAKKALAQKARALIGSLYTEDEDTAAEKLAALLMDFQGPAEPVSQVDVDAIAKAAAAQARQQMLDEQLRQQETEAYRAFQTEFPQIVQDEDMFAVADRISTRIAAEDPTLSPLEVMREAGRQTLEKFGRKPNGTETGAPNANGERRDRKRELQPMPRTTSRAAQTGQPEESDRPATPEEVVAQMRAARGQPT